MWLQPTHKHRSHHPPLEGRKLPPQRKTIALKNGGYPGAACLYTSTPAALVNELASFTPLKDPHIHHPAVLREKMQPKRWFRSCMVVHCPPEASSTCLASVPFPKENFVYHYEEQTHCPSVSISIKILEE